MAGQCLSERGHLSGRKIGSGRSAPRGRDGIRVKRGFKCAGEKRLPEGNKVSTKQGNRTGVSARGGVPVVEGRKTVQ
ncbi:hypothetical protein Y88_1246 [Novosphingobium nitrogenifigens DSM 19370]|uniref:Uncharacterized protein n=1 Tax=Novosphingobium nitrogenifigens DSM 19370 TaxID=983920 RepID=F1Z842_9SPHN|nr:hypothetical protein Y88_1246 [Novosphingobium nitrogenifigens DSM 19370]